MSEETVPISFTAVDNLSKAVEQMTKLLEKMNVAQEENTEETEKATKATEEQAEKTSFLSGALGKAFAAVELIKSGYEVMSAAIGFGVDQVGKMNEAWDEQSKKTGKAASALGSITEASNSLEKAQTKVYASLGKAIDRSSVYQAYTMAATDSLKEFDKWLLANNHDIAEFGNQLGVNGAQQLQNFGNFLKANSETIARVIALLTGAKDGVVFFKDAVLILVDTLKIALFGALTVVSQGVLELTNGLIYLMKAAGQDIPQALEDMRIGLENTSKYGVQGMVDSAGELEKSVDKAIGSATKMVDNIGLATTGTREELKGTISTINAVGDAAVKTGEKIEKNLRAGVRGGGKARGDGEADAEAEAEKAQAKSLDFEKRILQARQAGNELYAIELESEKALYELNLKLQGIKTEELRFQTLTLETLKIETEEKEKRKALTEEELRLAKEAYAIEAGMEEERRKREDEALAKQKEKYDIAIANIKSREQAELEAVTLVSEAMAEAFANVPDMIDGISDSTSRMLNGFGKATLKTGDLTKAFMKMNAQGATAEDQQEAINQAVGAGAGVLSGVTQAFIEDKRKQAAIEALINAAAAAASYATGNIPAGIAYTAAAVTYGAAAAFGGGGGAPAPSGGGAGMTGGGSGISNVENERRATAEAIAEAINDSRNNSGVTINLSFDNALIASDSPQAARILTDLISPEIESIVRNNR